MVQSRVWDFGALLTQGRKKAFASGVLPPGVYSGFQPTIINGTTLELSAGSILLPNGVLITEDAATQITVSTPGTATDYTVTIDHDDIQAVGGSSAFYTLRTGILGRSGDPSPNSVAVLWIRHPGAAALDASMFSIPVGPKPQAPGDQFVAAPFPGVFDEILGSNITVSNQPWVVQGDTSAMLGPVSFGVITVTGLVGMTADSVGRFLTTSGAVNPLNEGTFRILSFISSSSVTISDNGVAPGAETVPWEERELNTLGVQVVNSAVTGLQAYQFRIGVPPGVLPRSLELYGSLPSLATVVLDTNPYEMFSGDGDLISVTPSSLAGPVNAVDPRGTGIGSFVLGNYEESDPPVSIGVTVNVPAQTAGVFLKGFALRTD